MESARSRPLITERPSGRTGKPSAVRGVHVEPDAMLCANFGDLSTGSTLAVVVVPTVAMTAIGM